MKKITIIAIMMMLVANSAMADKKRHIYNDRGADVVVVHKKHSCRPVVKSCTMHIKGGRHGGYRSVIARAECIKGVMDARWNPRTHEVIVYYDARMTTARHIMNRI